MPCFSTRLLSAELSDIRTSCRCVLAHVLLLVAAEETLALRLGGWATGKLLVEAHHLLHADRIGGGPDDLGCVSACIMHDVFVEMACEMAVGGGRGARRSANWCGLRMRIAVAWDSPKADMGGLTLGEAI